MSKNERDTHFKGFAKLLLDELMTKYDHLPPGEWGPAEKDELIIARRAYDLIFYARWQTAYGMDLLDIARWIAEDVPDMTEWPEKGVKKGKRHGRNSRGYSRVASPRKKRRGDTRYCCL